MADKKSFLLYFDMYPMIRDLPADQRGELLSALFEYADAVWRRGSSKESVLQRFTQMGDGTRMAYAFIAETIRRDTEKWLGKQQRYAAAAKERSDRAKGAILGAAPFGSWE